MIKLFDSYSEIISYTRIVKFEQFGANLRFRAEIAFIDGSRLFVRETIIDKKSRKYSYHWQDEKERLLIRWDNAPDWEVETFPHHKHVEQNIEPSYERTLEQVMKVIANKLRTK